MVVLIIVSIIVQCYYFSEQVLIRNLTMKSLLIDTKLVISKILVIQTTFGRISTFEQLGMLLALMLQQLRLARVLFMTPLTGLRVRRDASDRLREGRVRQTGDLRK